MRVRRVADAIALYKKILAVDPRNRFALTSLGYASRESGNDRAAEKYFDLLAQDYPSLYVPYLALGDLFTALADFKKAEAFYAKAYTLAPKNALIVSGGMHAAIEAHDLALAGTWLNRVTVGMETAHQVLREKERYFSFEGDPQQSASLGLKAIVVLPQDRDVVVYLGYDFLRLEQYDNLLALTIKYKDILPAEPNIPLLAGYVYKHEGQLGNALREFSEAINRDPKMYTAYVNRGYVLNDLHKPEQAVSDFERGLKLDPKNGQAHLGLAFAELALDHSQAAVRQTQLAGELLGDSKLIHMIRATAYGREGLLTKATVEYQAALKFTPDDGSLYLGLGNIFFAEHRYREAIQELRTAQDFVPHDAAVYALMARTYAGLQDREQTLRNVRMAEDYALRTPVSIQSTGSQRSELSAIYVSTGQALSTIGDQRGAMERFSKALLVPQSNRVTVRLAIADLMDQQGRSEDTERQVALAQMEAAAGDTVPPTGDQYIEAAEIFQRMHEYKLSNSYLQRAKSSGASEIGVRIPQANNYLALGDTTRAAAELQAVSHKDDSDSNYQYLLAEAGVYEQQHHGTQTLSAFAAAASAAGEDQIADQALLQAGADEGLRINPNLSLLSNLIVQPIFEDSTVYVLDSKLDSPSGPVPSSEISELPPPRSSLETDWIAGYHLHLGLIPAAGGFFQLRNARGVISVPATNSIVNRDTFDYTMNFGLNPTFHLGNNVLTLNSGIQGTVRRDSLSPVQMNQNLFRVFTYLTTSSFFNAVSAQAFFIREAGPFTESPINERSLTGAVDFRVGAPWGKTALVTGWGSTDQRFPSAQLGNSENYYTSSYIGLAHRFPRHVNAEAIVEDLRTWRIVPFSPIHSAIAQALRPAATVDFSPAVHWNVQVSSAFESTRGFHVYDMTQNGFALSYTRPFGRTFDDETGEVHLKYPIRFSAGMQEETFPNFARGQNTQFRPYVSINLF
jgi:tetratricopeptide (TPR) repeat protein